MNYLKFKLLFHFYKSCLPLYFAFGILTILDSTSFFFAINFLGPIVVYLYKSQFRQNEYFFYYNKNLAKHHLYIFSGVLNMVFSLSVIIIKYVAHI